MRLATAYSAPDSLAAFSATSCSILITDATQRDNPIAYVNAAFSDLFGYSEAEAVGRNCRFLQGTDTDPLVVAEIRAAVASGTGIRRQILNYRKDGTPFWNELTIDPIRDAAGRLTGFVGVQLQTDPVHLANEAREQAESKLDSIASHIPGYIYRRVMKTDGTIKIVYCSPSLSKLLEIDETEVPCSFYDYVHPDDLDELMTAIRRSAAEMTIFREEYRLISRSGVTHWFRSDTPPRRTTSGEIVWDGLAIETGAEKRWRSEIANLALLDPLTSLLTREAWRQALALQFDAGNGVVGQCGILYVNIEAFRRLNDKLGQLKCDEILREIARRLKIISASVAGTAGRLGGDEFALLVPVCASDDALSQLARATSDSLAHPIQIGAQSLMIRTCIGATLSGKLVAARTADEDMTSELMMQAELALRWAKQAGCSSHVVYSAAQDDRFQNQAILARSLENAIENDELELHYQPMVDLASGRIVSAEALVRWNHPTLGLQRPDLFIPLAEKSGLIVQLGRWVLNQAVRQRTVWQQAGLTPPPIAINVSGSQLMEPAFVKFVADALTRLHASAGDFEIELTEGVLIEASAQIMASLHALRDMGFTIAIDDFGSGHATFRYLRDFPVDKVKLDQQFVRNLVIGSSDALIIRAIISLTRSMSKRLVAEGIETKMQRAFLLHEGCEIGQGYLFSMPLVAEDFAWMLANHVKLPLLAPAERSTDGKNIRSERGTGTHPR